MSRAQHIANDISADAALKHARWDERSWQELVAGPAAALEQSLGTDGSEPVLRAYLSLCAEGLALGYLYSASTEAQGFLNVMFRHVLPLKLMHVPQAQRLQTLATLWNLGENLEAQPFWISAVFLRRMSQLQTLTQLESFVESVSAELTRTPAPGTALTRAFWLDSSQSDERFLPGAVHFLAPTIACVHDRLRTGGAGRLPVATALWLTDEPVGLGPTRCTLSPQIDCVPSLEVSALQRKDPMVDEPLATARSDAGLILTLRTSQRIVAVVP